MPLYVYKCSKGHEHEAIKKVEDRGFDKCRVCGKMATLIPSVSNLNKYPVQSVRLNGEEIR